MQLCIFVWITFSAVTCMNNVTQIGRRFSRALSNVLMSVAVLPLVGQASANANQPLYVF